MSVSLVEVHCAGICCDEVVSVRLNVPEGWDIAGFVVEEQPPTYGAPMCPKCAPQRGFFQDQCPGCVAGAPECGLWDLTAFGERSRGFNEQERALIRSGVCPARVNGSFGFSRGGGFADIDLSEKASDVSGAAVLAGFDALMEAFPIGTDPSKWNRASKESVR